MATRTLFLSKLFGLYFVLTALSMIFHKRTTVETVAALLHNSALMFLVGIITLGAGLAMVLAHNVWSGGVLGVIVTLIGWITLVKSLLFLFLPPEMEAGFFLSTLHYEQFFYLYAGFSLVLGGYLTYGGFASTSHS